MQSLTLGALTFTADSSGIAVSYGEEPGRRVALSSHDAARLEDFLRQHVPKERRVGFRVRIAPLEDRVRSAFRVQLCTGTRTLEVRPVDFSLTGILVEARGFVVRRGTEFPVHLDFDGLTCRLTASVVRLEGDLVALHFVESLKGGELTPPEALLGMYRRLETEWLRSRRRQAP